jgi:hypothetical protein
MSRKLTLDIEEQDGEFLDSVLQILASDKQASPGVVEVATRLLGNLANAREFADLLDKEKISFLTVVADPSVISAVEQ